MKYYADSNSFIVEMKAMGYENVQSIGGISKYKGMTVK